MSKPGLTDEQAVAIRSTLDRLDIDLLSPEARRDPLAFGRGVGKLVKDFVVRQIAQLASRQDSTEDVLADLEARISELERRDG